MNNLPQVHDMQDGGDALRPPINRRGIGEESNQSIMSTSFLSNTIISSNPISYTGGSITDPPEYNLWTSHIPTILQFASNPLKPNEKKISIINEKILTFNVHFGQRSFAVQMPQTATVENLRNKIADDTCVPLFCQAISGWPFSKVHDAQILTTKLYNLHLNTETELILIDLAKEPFSGFEAKIVRRLNETFWLSIVEQPSSRLINLSFSGQTTIAEVKANVYCITDIPGRYQEWSGWPHGCVSNTRLAYTGIEICHNFVLKNRKNKITNNSNSLLTSNDIIVSTGQNDSESSEDEYHDALDYVEFEDTQSQ